MTRASYPRLRRAARSESPPRTNRQGRISETTGRSAARKSARSSVFCRSTRIRSEGSPAQIAPDVKADRAQTIPAATDRIMSKPPAPRYARPERMGRENHNGRVSGDLDHRVGFRAFVHVDPNRRGVPASGHGDDVFARIEPRHDGGSVETRRLEPVAVHRD